MLAIVEKSHLPTEAPQTSLLRSMLGPMPERAKQTRLAAIATEKKITVEDNADIITTGATSCFKLTARW